MSSMTTKHILVADDDLLIRTLVVDFLSAKKYHVSAVDSGQGALDFLQKTKPDLLFLDLIMPDLNGIEVLKTIRTTETLAALPVILLSANSDTDKLSSDQGVAADRYLLKPFNFPELMQIVQELIG